MTVFRFRVPVDGYVTGRNGQFKTSAIEVEELAGFDLVQLRHISAAREIVLNADAALTPGDMDRLCLEWCRRRNLDPKQL